LDDPQKKLNNYYQRQSLSSDRARSILVEGRALAAQQRRRAWFWRTAALAATIAIAGGLVWSNLPSPPPTGLVVQTASAATINLSSVQIEVMAFFETPNYELAQISLDQPELLNWLATQSAPASLQVPTELNDLDTLGCHVLDVSGEQVFIMCFYLDGVPRDANGVAMPGKKPMMVAATPASEPPVTVPSTVDAPSAVDEPAPMMKKPTTLVHLVSIPRAKFQNAPLAGDPVQRSSDGMWSFATWTQGDVVYVTASPAEAERFNTLADQLGS
jgi:hypothetical protein